MSGKKFRKCIEDEAAAGRVSGERAQEAMDLYDDLELSYRDTMNEADAEAAARARTIDALSLQHKERLRRQALQGIAQVKAVAAIQGNANLGDGFRGLFSALHGAGRSLEGRHRYIRGQAHGRMADVLATFTRDLFGNTPNQDTLRDVVFEAFSEGTGNAAAKDLAQAWGQAAEYLRLRFNAAGGAIAKRMDWGLPQMHSTLKIRKASYAAWRAFIVPRLNLARMIDFDTGQPFTTGRLEAILPGIWADLRTDGFASLTPTGVNATKALARRHADPRFFAFKDANAWMEYQTAFGEADAFNAMMHHIDVMSRDTAALEILGPNPNATITYLEQWTMRQALMADLAKGGDIEERQARSAIHHGAAMWDHYTGTANTPAGLAFARTMSTIRQTIVAAKLGGAFLSATSDVGFQAITAKFNGLSYARMARQIANNLDPLDAGDRIFAVRQGLVAEEWSGMAAMQQRYIGETMAHHVSQRLADFTLRASLLSPWTQAGRHAFGLEFQGALADQLGKAFADMPEPLANALRRYGIAEDRWLRLAPAMAVDRRGAKFLSVEAVAASDDDLATRIMEMIQTETEYAVPSHSLAAKSIFTQTRPGTILGELARSAVMFKTFAVTMLYTHLRRAASEMARNHGVQKNVYVAELIIATTIMGALAVQLKEISKGRNPRPIDDKAFWAGAMAQGGGLGIYGDYLFADQNRFGRGMAETVAGPVVGLASDVARLTLGNAQEVFEGKKTNAGREFVRFARDNMPGGSIWYARLALDRLIWDELERMADPNFRRNVARRLRDQRKTYGNDYWWAPGDTAPGVSEFNGEEANP
jgi:hypothetical protein